MTPSPEAVEAADTMRQEGLLSDTEFFAQSRAAKAIDASLAPYREQVRRLVEAMKDMDEIPALCGEMRKPGDPSVAAWARWHERLRRSGLRAITCSVSVRLETA